MEIKNLNAEIYPESPSPAVRYTDSGILKLYFQEVVLKKKCSKKQAKRILKSVGINLEWREE